MKSENVLRTSENDLEQQKLQFFVLANTKIKLKSHAQRRSSAQRRVTNWCGWLLWQHKSRCWWFIHHAV